TTSRCLWNEVRNQQEHTRRFDLKALDHVIIKAAGPTTSDTSFRFKKLADGGFNEVFLAVVDERRLIVKIPDPAIPPRLVRPSEVATLEFLLFEQELRVLKVLSWSDNSDNSVGCECIIMEEAQRRALSTVRERLGIDDKFSVVNEVLSMQKRFVA
ncbi:uncharacterized protein A1O5_10054, partial [Cladophialophora psammophila CBS 110553]